MAWSGADLLCQPAFLLASRSMFLAEEAGETAGRSLVVFVSVVLIILLLQVALAWFVLERGGQATAARFLAAYLMLQVFSWGPLLADLRIAFGEFVFLGFRYELGLGSGIGHQILGALVFAFLPSILIGFSLTYPTIHPAIRARPWLLAAPFVLSILLAVAALSTFPFGAMQTGSGLAEPPPESLRFRGVVLLVLAYLALATAGSAAVFLTRIRRATTSLEARRLRYMTRWIVVPSLIGLSLFLLLGALGTIVVESDSAFLLLLLLFSLLVVLFAVVPPIAFTFGLLRYRILDLEQRVRRGGRFALRRGSLLSFFVLVSFALTEIMELFIEARTGSLLLGLTAAAFITVTMTPLHRSAERLTDRLIPPDDSKEKGSERHRLLLYRATYEDVTADGEITARERRTLESLARALGLREGAASAIAEAVALERSGAPPMPPGTPVPS